MATETKGKCPADVLVLNMSIEKALKRYPVVKSVLVEADMSKISREELAARSSIDTEVSL